MNVINIMKVRTCLLNVTTLNNTDNWGSYDPQYCIIAKILIEINMHADHSKDIKRLNRIIGQLEGIKRMIDDKRYCPDILIQTRAAKSAIKSLEASILGKHLDHCVKATFTSKNKSATKEKIEEIIKIFKKNM